MPERAISRVLSRTIIHLGQLSPTASSNLPGSPLGTGGTTEAAYSPIWSCSGRGLPCHELLPVARCALTAPFHPYRPRPAVYFLWHFPWTHAPQVLPGALSEGARTFLHNSKSYSDCQAHSGISGRQVYRKMRGRSCAAALNSDQCRSAAHFAVLVCSLLATLP
jgi:hypothetical protein